MLPVFKKIFVAVPIMGLYAISYAQTQKINIITTAVPFLRISPDARAGAMGETGIVTSPDAGSQFYNVAKYPFTTNKSGVSLNYTPWLRKLGLNDVYLASAAGYYKVGEEQVISASLRYFSLGNLQLTDHNGSDLYSSHPREMSFDAGYSRKLSAHFSMGLALRYIHSNLSGDATTGSTTYKAGNAVAADLGLYYSTVKEGAGGWNAGAVFSNLGSKISYSSDKSQKNFLPANLGVGIGYTWILSEVNKLSLNSELNKLMVPTISASATDAEYRAYSEKSLIGSWGNSFGNKAMSYSFGAEYVYDNQFALRAGYYADSRNMGKRNYFTTGLGVNYSYFGFNFSYLIPSGKGVTVDPLSNTLRFSLLINPVARK
jgi:hypothetical protein